LNQPKLQLQLALLFGHLSTSINCSNTWFLHQQKSTTKISKGRFKRIGKLIGFAITTVCVVVVLATPPLKATILPHNFPLVYIYVIVSPSMKSTGTSFNIFQNKLENRFLT
jgi:hypothetical protein